MYETGFNPILKRSHTVTLIGSKVSSSFKCRAVDALPSYIKDFGALTAATWANDNEDTNLEVGKFELVQMRMRVLDDIQVRLKNPPSVQKWRTAKTSFVIRKFPDIDSASVSERELTFAMSEFYYWEDGTPRFDLYSVPLMTTARIEFVGWKYLLEPITGPGQFELLVDGWPGMR